MTDLAQRVVPICNVCHKPVEEFERRNDPTTRRIHYTARCHGQEQSVVLTQEQLEDCIGQPLLAMAFCEVALEKKT